ncbi:hypothetical protein JCM19376_28740 [Fusibacter bizertensis]
MMNLKIISVKSVVIAIACICLGFGIGFGDTVKGASSQPNYFFNGNEFEPIPVYEVVDMDGNSKDLILLRDLTHLGYALEWNSTSRTIDITHSTKEQNFQKTVIKKGTIVTLSDVKTHFYTDEAIDTYIANGLSFISLERLPYAYYDYLPDSWARPYIFSLNAKGYFHNDNKSFSEIITAEQLSPTIASVLSDNLASFKRTEYIKEGKSDFEGLTDAGVFSGFSISSGASITRETMTRIGKNILDMLHVDYTMYSHIISDYSDRDSVSLAALASVDLFYNAGVLTVNAEDKLLPKNKVTAQEAGVILSKMLAKFGVMEAFVPYTSERTDLASFKLVDGAYDITGFTKPITLSESEPKLTLYGVSFRTMKEVITIEIDQDYAPMGGIYAKQMLNPQIIQVDVVLKTGEVIQKRMGRMPNYNYIGSGIYRTSLQITPPVQGVDESSEYIQLDEIESIILHAPNEIALRIKM